MTEAYGSRVYQAASGQWSWVIVDPYGEEMVRGAGYETEQEAQLAMAEHFQSYTVSPLGNLAKSSATNGKENNSESSS